MSVIKYFLGLHIGHDRAISIANSKEIIFHSAVERFDRNKFSDSYKIPINEIKLVINYLGLRIEDFKGICISYLASDASKISKTLEAEFKCGFPNFIGRFSTLDHHLAHAIGAKVCSDFEESLVFVADGAGDQRFWGSQAESVYYLTKDTFYLLDERIQDRPFSHINKPEFFDLNFFRPDDYTRQISLGLKYEQITYLCGFGPGQAGQTMALAAFGKKLFDFSHLLPKNLSFSLEYPDFLIEFDKIAKSESKTLNEFAKESKSDIACTFQTYLEDAISILVYDIVNQFDPKNLCFSGGLFLNCLANQRLLREHPAKNLFFFSACNDEGQSIGTVAYSFWQEFNFFPECSIDYPYLGRSFNKNQCIYALKNAMLDYRVLGEKELSKYLANLISKGMIVGILRGRSETGPRALGHRSILADPTNIISKQRLDEGIKKRAMFRPYAPVITRESVNKFFDFNSDSPYMLFTAQIKKEFQPLLPSITHVDGSTRPQTVIEKEEPFLYNLLKQFERIKGVPILLNTSFNDEIEPIVDSPNDAIRIFKSTDLDILVLENCVHIKPK